MRLLLPLLKPFITCSLHLFPLLCQGLRVCNMIEGGITPLHSYEELKAMGFQIIIHPMSSIFAVTKVV